MDPDLSAGLDVHEQPGLVIDRPEIAVWEERREDVRARRIGQPHARRHPGLHLVRIHFDCGRKIVRVAVQGAARVGQRERPAKIITEPSAAAADRRLPLHHVTFP